MNRHINIQRYTTINYKKLFGGSGISTNQKIRDLLKLFPDIKPKEASLKLEIPYTKSFANSFYRMKNLPPNTPKKRKVPKSIPPQNTPQDALRFIENPDELLLSTAIRELNKPNPDPRWATILINCKKENISTKTEVIDKFKQLSIQARVNILKGLSQKTQ